jgi:predicted RNase H-like HicB family nuclease
MMKTLSVVVEKCPQTGLYVGYVTGLPGAHTQAETLDELENNLCEVLSILLEDGKPEDKLSVNFYLANPCVDD